MIYEDWSHLSSTYKPDETAMVVGDFAKRSLQGFQFFRELTTGKISRFAIFQNGEFRSICPQRYAEMKFTRKQPPILYIFSNLHNKYIPYRPGM